jgi:hypothetical protein
LPRSFVASPDTYRVIAQNKQYKVVDVVWTPGQRDVPHSHPASAVYYLTDCSLRVHGLHAVHHLLTCWHVRRALPQAASRRTIVEFDGQP